VAGANRVVGVERFVAQSEYRSHDWRAEPDGASLLAEIVKAFPRPGIEAQLRELRARYEQAVSGWLAAGPGAGER
jgi:hypothetical protein